MNNINQYITEKLKIGNTHFMLEKLNRTKSSLMLEKLKINSKSKIRNSNSTRFNQETEDRIIDELCRYFQHPRTHKGIHYDTGLEVLEKFFNNWVSDFLDYNQGDYEKLAELVGVDVNDLAKYIEDNHEELYKEIKDFVLV